MGSGEENLGARAAITLAMIGATLGQNCPANAWRSSAIASGQRTVTIFLAPACNTFFTEASRTPPTAEAGVALRRSISKKTS